MRVRRGSASRAGIVYSPRRTATIAAAMKAYHANNAMNGQRNIATAAMMPDATSTSIELSIPPMMHVTCPREGAPGLNVAALLVKSAWIHALQYNEARQNDGGASTRLPAAPAKGCHDRRRSDRRTNASR